MLLEIYVIVKFWFPICWLEGEDIFVCVFLCWKLTLLCLIQLCLKLKIFLVSFYAGNLRFCDCFVKLCSLERVCFFGEIWFFNLDLEIDNIHNTIDTFFMPQLAELTHCTGGV